MPDELSFRSCVEQIVADIPAGRVMTYGQIAALCGKPRAARIVGGIAHYGNPELPWHRVVNKAGGFARGYPGGAATHQQHLQNENTPINGKNVIMEEALWTPKKRYR